MCFKTLKQEKKKEGKTVQEPKLLLVTGFYKFGFQKEKKQSVLIEIRFLFCLQKK